MSSSPTAALVAPQIENILFATDFSDCSRMALPYVRAIARQYGARVQVVHVIAPEPKTAVPMDTLPATMDTVKAAAESAMAAFLGDDALLGIPHGVFIERGPMSEALESLLDQEDIDLIVLGTHGRRGWKKFVLGSVAEQIFRQAPCPVLTVGPHVTTDSPREGKLGRILYATDFSPGSMHALPYALSIAERRSAHLMLLHVAQDGLEVMGQSLDDVLAALRRKLQDLLPAEIVQQLHPEVLVKYGPAAGTILEMALDRAADLIVMGAHRARIPAAAAHVPWAVASAVVAQAHCPVLTVRS